MTKRIIAALTAVIMCACFASCGDTGESQNPAAAPAETTTAAAAPETSSEAADSKADEEKKEKEASSASPETQNENIDEASGGSGITSGNRDAGAAQDEDSCPENGSGSANGGSGNGNDNKQQVTAPSDSSGNRDSENENIKKKDVIITDNMISFNGMTIKLCGNGYLAVDEGNLEAEPTEDELKGAVEAALAQYRAAENKDLDAFIKTFHFEDLADPTADLVRDINQYPGNSEFLDYIEKNKLRTKYEVIDDVTDLIEELVDEDTMDKLSEEMNNADPENINSLRQLLRMTYSGISASSKTVKENIENRSIYDSEGPEPIKGINDKSVYCVYVEYCSRDKDSVYMSIDIIIVAGEDQYELDEVLVWNTNNRYGVFLNGNMDHGPTEEEIKGKTPKEIFELAKEEAMAEQ